MELNYCRRCGGELTESENGAFVCSNGHSSYPNPAPCVALFLIDSDDQILMGVRGREPMKGTLDAFGGFIDGAESFEEALTRGIKEEIGLEPSEYTSPIYLTSAYSTYDFQSEKLIVLSSIFYAYLLPGAKPTAADDVAAIHTAPINDIQIEKIGNEDIRRGFLALKQRLDGTA